jgi:hypothetical protein
MSQVEQVRRQIVELLPRLRRFARTVARNVHDADDLVQLAADRGYLMWIFRPVRGGIWAEYADDATLTPEGRRSPPCPYHPIPPACSGKRKTVYRFGVPAGIRTDAALAN